MFKVMRRFSRHAVGDVYTPRSGSSEHRALRALGFIAEVPDPKPSIPVAKPRAYARRDMTAAAPGEPVELPKQTAAQVDRPAEPLKADDKPAPTE